MTGMARAELEFLRGQIPMPRRDVCWRTIPLVELQQDDLLRIFTILLGRREENLGISTDTVNT